MSKPEHGELRQLNESQAFEAMRIFLHACWARDGRPEGQLAVLLKALTPMGDPPADSGRWQDWRAAVAQAGAATGASEIRPAMEVKQLGFFSDWYIAMTWPSGKTQRLNGFKNEAHARGWIEHESTAWLANNRQP